MLQGLYCSNNQLTQLDNLNLPMLRELVCSNNQLTQLVLQNTINIQIITYNDNLIEFIAPNLRRAINRKQNIYKDSQNVHNHTIQECICESIHNIISVKPTINNLHEYIINANLNNQSKQLLFEYMEDKTVHSTLNITFEELLLHTLSRIDINEHKDEIFKILDQELQDSLCKCYTGRMSRLINCLNGFDSIVNIQISDAEQIGQIISITKESMTEYNTVKHKELVYKELHDRGYTDDVINEWIQYIE